MPQAIHGIRGRDENGITSFGCATGGEQRGLGKGSSSLDDEEQEADAPKPDVPIVGGRAAHFIGIYRKGGWM
jgi:hypothetical protein